MKTRWQTLAVIAVACVGLVPLTRASTITWNSFGNNVVIPNNPWPAPVLFTSGAYQLQTWGFATMDTTPYYVLSSMYGKYTSGNALETGLGMVDDSGGDHEIDQSHWITISTSVLGGPPTAALADSQLGSVQMGEDGAVFGSNTLGVKGIQLGYTTVDGGVIDISTWAKSWKYLSFGISSTATNPLANVLIMNVSANVPDSGTTALLLGLGLLGMGLAVLRSKSTKKA